MDLINPNHNIQINHNSSRCNRKMDDNRYYRYPTTSTAVRTKRTHYPGTLSSSLHHHHHPSSTTTTTRSTTTTTTTTRMCLVLFVTIFHLLLFCTIPTTAHYYSNYFRKTPKEHYLEPQGLNLELTCITERKDITCIWLMNGNVRPASPTKYQYNPSSVNGDCSLVIHNLTYPLDNGQWQCQVPSYSIIDYSQSDASKTIQWPTTEVVVLVKPSAPKIAYENSFLSKITANQVANLTCQSHGGNPSPRIEWFLDTLNITDKATTTINEQRQVISKLAYTFTKRNNGSILSCIAVHPYENQNTTLLLDVHYKPIISVTKKRYTVNENDNLEIDCMVDANPPATVYWKPSKEFVSSSATKMETLPFNSGTRLKLTKIDRTLDNIIFDCSASNNIGNSMPESVNLDVLYEPRLLEAPAQYNKVQLGSEIKLECKFVGNPKPSIRWNFIDGIYGQDHVPETVGDNPGLLVLKNVSYLNEGEYYCEGVNHNTLTRTQSIARSNQIKLDIVGKPQFLTPKLITIGYRGLNTRVEQVFCSDPFPTKVYWNYDSMRLDVDLNLRPTKEEFIDDNLDGFHIKPGRLVSLNVKNPTCFSAALMVANTDIADKRDYSIVVQNALGTAEAIATLQVHSPLSGAILISISLIVLIMLFIVTIIAIFILRRRRGCGGAGSGNSNGSGNGGGEGGGNPDEEKSPNSQVPIHDNEEKIAV